MRKSTLGCNIPNDRRFDGTWINSGAQKTVIGLNQPKAYLRAYSGKIMKNESEKRYRFGNIQYKFVGAVQIRMPLVESNAIDIIADVVDVDLFFLPGLDALTKLKLVLDMGNDVIMQPKASSEVSLVRKYDQLYIKWPKTLIFTTVELKRVHRHFVHTRSEKILKLLRKANPHKTAAIHLEKLEMVTIKCDVCQRLAVAPTRFRVTFPNSNCTFNRCACLELMKIDPKTVQYAVDCYTKFYSARFLPIKTITAI